MRLFFALGFSPATRQAIAQVQQRLRRAAPTARCPAEGNLHLTLAFLGEVPPARLEDATAALEALSPPAAGAAALPDRAVPPGGRPVVAGAGALPGAFRPAGGAHLPAGAAGAVVPAGGVPPPRDAGPEGVLPRGGPWCGSAPPPTLGGSLRPGEFGALPADSCRSAL